MPITARRYAAAIAPPGVDFGITTNSIKAGINHHFN
jgi:hypothetical protein